MFQQIFKDQLTLLGVDKISLDRLWIEIQNAYTKKNRHYHNLEHLDNLANELFAIKEEVGDWETMVFSIAYHDIIYNCLKTDNEQKSANLAHQRLTALSLPLWQKDKCVRQILATKGHETSTDNDTNLFTDADLSILGKDELQYSQYASMIRKEYRFYPDLLYNPGRRKVLQHFLGMSSIFKTIHFRDTYEAQARLNLANELEALV